MIVLFGIHRPTASPALQSPPTIQTPRLNQMFQFGKYLNVKILILCGLAVVCFAGMVFQFGNAGLLKCLLLVSSAVGAAEIARANSYSSIRDVVVAAAMGSGLVWGLLGFVVVVAQHWGGEWAGLLPFAFYIAFAGAMFFGIVGALVGLLYYACTRKT